jgi:MFS family permease
MNPLLGKNFIFLITANCLAFCGWVFRNYLINWYVLEKTNSTLMVGLIAAIPTFFVLFISPFGGQLADKFSRKKIFLIARIISFIFFFLVALFVHMNFYPILFIVLCFSGIGIAAGLEVSASRTLILDIAGFKYLTWGNSITEFLNSFLSTIGPLAIAVFFTSISNTEVFFSMPAVHLISAMAALMLFIYFKEAKNEDDNKEDGIDKSIKDGIIYSYKSVNIRILLILTFTILFWALSQPLIPKIARDVLGSGSSGYAILLSSEALGAMIGSIALPLFPKIFRNSKSIVVCILIYSIALFFFSLSTSIFLSVFLLAVGGFFHVIWFTVILILLQTLPDTNHKGRVVGLFFTVIQAYGLGFILGGLLGESIGIVPTIITASIVPIIVHFICYGVSKEFRVLKS